MNTTFESTFTAALIQNAYQNAWNEFYEWEQTSSSQALRSLARPPLPNTPQAQADADSDMLDLPGNNVIKYVPAPDHEDPRNETEVDSFTVIDYNEGASPPQITTLSVETINVTAPFEPCAPYEMCTPANRNIYVGDDSDYMPFLPLADDPEFDYTIHITEYGYFEWQVLNHDPDLGVIIIQAAHRLNTHHQVPFQIIDDTKLLPLPLLPIPSGLIHISQRRDFPKWPLLPRPLPLPLLSSHETTSPATNLKNLVQYFCSNINCMIGYCTVHLGEMPVPEPISPTLNSNSLVCAAEAPCSSRCFLLGKTSPIDTIWNQNDLDTFQTVLALSPDLSPCDLAIICRKPCREVFKRRCHIFPDSTILKPTDKTIKTIRPRLVKSATLRYQDHDAASFTPNPPCSHPGPCDARVKCSCFANSAHCEMGCRCDLKCNRRWQGCSCAHKSRTICGTNKCSCYLAHRECDPRVCIKCGAKGTCLNQKIDMINPFLNGLLVLDIKTGLCQNVSIQHGERKRTEVRQSRWGLGLYIAEAAKEEDLIIEYTGEIILDLTTKSRDYVSKHRGRTYLFQLNPTMSIDSGKAGNESRFINHDVNSNCHACVRLVNGEHRIGLFALRDLKPGEEILLNYGDSFFLDEDNAKNGSTVKMPVASLEQSEYQSDQHSSDDTYNE